MRKRRPISHGTLLMLVLTVVVVAGGLFLFRKMSDDTTRVYLDPKVFVSAVDQALTKKKDSIATSTPVPTIKTTVVTIAPSNIPPSSGATEIPKQAELTATKSPSVSLSMTVSGMAMFRTDIADAAVTAEKTGFDFSPILASVAPYVQGDFNLLTLEGLLTGSITKYNNLVVPKEAAAALKAGGFDTALVNHEHSLDYGLDGLTATVQAIKAAGMNAAGAAVENALPKVFRVNNVNVALLTYTDALATKSKENAKKNPDVMPLIDAAQVASDIASAKAQGASLIIVSLHWGKEDAESVTNAQRETARKIAQAGADIILGAGTNSVLPIEMLETSGRKTLVAYSMGTLLTDQRTSRAEISGILLHVRVTIDPVLSTVDFDTVEYTPTYVWKQKINGKNQFRVLPSALSAPENMSAEQSKYMSNSLAFIEKMLANGPAVRRK